MRKGINDVGENIFKKWRNQYVIESSVCGGVSSIGVSESEEKVKKNGVAWRRNMKICKAWLAWRKWQPS
jgi:hypothetical protein